MRQGKIGENTMKKAPQNVNWALKKESISGKWPGGETQGAIPSKGRKHQKQRPGRWGSRTGWGMESNSTRLNHT